MTRTLILSDLHLGAPASRGPELLDGLRLLARGYDRVILNGDTLDRYEAPGCEEQAERLRADVLDACASRCGPPELLAGNHDPALTPAQWVYLEPSRTLVFHGDCIADCTHPSKPEERAVAARLKQRWRELGGRPERFVDLVGHYRDVQARDLRENPRIREKCSRLVYLIAQFLPPWKPLQIVSYWQRAPRLIAHLAATFEKPVRRAVVGHTHRPGAWDIGGIRVFNTGSCMPMSAPFAITASGADVEYRPLESLLRKPPMVFAPLTACHSGQSEE